MIPLTIGVIGGTGPQGKGLAYRFALAGHTVTLGSRSTDRALAAAEDIGDRLTGTGSVSGAANEKAAEVNEVVLLAVPWDGHAELLAELSAHLAGKIVISCVNPLGFDTQGPYGLCISEGSAAEQAAEMLPKSRLVGAFYHVSAAKLLEKPQYLDQEDVLICGDDWDAKQVVAELAHPITGRAGLDIGPLRLSHQLESLTAVLISINKHYKTCSGIHIAGIPMASR